MLEASRVVIANDEVDVDPELLSQRIYCNCRIHRYWFWLAYAKSENDTLIFKMF